MSLATHIVEAIRQMNLILGAELRFIVIAHPMAKKNVEREHVATEILEAGFEVEFIYRQCVGEGKYVIKRHSLFDPSEWPASVEAALLT